MRAFVFYGHILNPPALAGIATPSAPPWWAATNGDWRFELARRLRPSTPTSAPAAPATGVGHLSQQAIDIARTSPVELAHYGYDDAEQRWTVRVKASVQNAGDSAITRLTPLTIAPEWNGELARFVELLELSVPSTGPGFHLAFAED